MRSFDPFTRPATGRVQFPAMRSAFITLLLLLVGAACAAQPQTWPQTEQPLAPTASPLQATVTATLPAMTPSSIPPTPPTVPVATATPVAALPAAPLSAAAARAAAALDLVETAPPSRDDVELAVAYRGVDPAVATLSPPPDLRAGMTELFYIGNIDSNTVGQIEAELLSVGENAYFWFEQGVDPDPVFLNEATAAFDRIYDALYAYFGIVEPLGGRVHIVHAAPETLCDVPDRCGLAGYFSSRDLLPRVVTPWSNERAMFVMNARQFGGQTYLDTLSHELRHLLGHTYDQGEEDWFLEGAAMLAEDLSGFPTLPQARGSLFLENPDQQLNSWTDGNTIPYYGQGYLLNRFLYDRLGADGYRAFSLSPRTGLDAVEEVAAEGEAITGEQVWLDWLAAMALRGAADVPEAYRWEGPELGPLATTPARTLPARFETTVNQFAADYYELPSSGAVALNFSGAGEVSLLGVPAPSGEFIWYAQRANSSNPRLTRAVDLRDVAEATLHYQVYADIERGYDFAYVSVSTDGGRTWQGLEAAGMQGLDPADDPSHSALTDRFYTGRSGQWTADTADLTPYAGQEILLRFEYVTDLVLTFGGFAVDDIAIPEIGFFDDAESPDSGWTAEGFVRATAALPQDWRLQLITFDGDGRPTLQVLEPAPDGRLTHVYEALPGVRNPILIVAALSPETLQSATYVLEVRAP